MGAYCSTATKLLIGDTQINYIGKTLAAAEEKYKSFVRIELIKKKFKNFFFFFIFLFFIKGFETFKNKKSQPRGHMGRAEMFFEASRALSNTSGCKIYENVCRTHSLACQNHLQASRKIRFARINADRQSFDPECSWNQLHMDTSSY